MRSHQIHPIECTNTVHGKNQFGEEGNCLQGIPKSMSIALEGKVRVLTLTLKRCKSEYRERYLRGAEDSCLEAIQLGLGREPNNAHPRAILKTGRMVHPWTLAQK